MKVSQIILVKKNSQKAILIGKAGQKIKHIGTDTRPEMEKLFKKKVFLDLKVSFQPKKNMKINDLGFFLGNKKYGENSMIVYILSKNNGLIKSFSKFSKKKRFSFTILDKVNFTWQSKQKDSLGYINLDLEASIKKNDTFINSLIKSSASELCIKFLPLWQQNFEIYNDLQRLIKKFR